MARLPVARPAARMRRKRITVEGEGLFPLDMLRYDMAWPSSEHDCVEMMMTVHRRIDVLTDRPAAPSYGRWQSFGWTVVQMQLEGWESS